MDHCPLPPGKGHIKVRNFTVTPYTADSKGFLGYPARRGWSSDDLNSRDFQQLRPVAEVRDFFQGWLFFGCVIEFLAICGISAQHGDFLTPDGQSVTTKRLTQMLQEWKQIARKRQVVDSMRIPTTIQAALILGTVRDFLDDYCLPRGGGQGLQADMRARLVAKSPLPQRVWMSIIALGHALTSAMISGCDIRRTGSRWGGSMVLEQRMLAKRWCPQDVHRMLSDYGGTVYEQYYLAKMTNAEITGSQDDRDRAISHEECTEFECRGRNIDQKTYRQFHARSCDGECGGFRSADLEKLTTIIKAGDIPVFKWNLETKKLELEAAKVNGKKVGEPPFMAISHIWSDGLGNQDDNAIYVCQLEALQHSVETAGQNHKMPVRNPSHFWIDTLCVPVQKENKDLRKKCIRDMWRIYESSCSVLVLCSLRKTAATAKGPERRIAEHLNNWDRRLWTYQECIMARKRLIQYADKTVDHVSIEADFYRDKLWAPWSVADPLAPLASKIAARSTSKKSDEMLCLATIMRLDIEPFLNAETLLKKEKGLGEKEEVSDVELADRRTEIFWQTIRECQWGVLFNSHRRLTIEGLRWAPATFLGCPSGGFVKQVDQGYCRLDDEGRGLSFTAPAIVIETPSTWSATSSALIIEVSDPAVGRVCVEVTLRDLSFPSQTFTWSPATKYAILLEKPLSLHVASTAGGPMAKLPRTRPELETWLEETFQPGRVNKLAIDAIVTTVRNPTIGGGSQIRHECIAVAKIVDSPVLDKLEEEKYTIWDEPSRHLLASALQMERILSSPDNNTADDEDEDDSSGGSDSDDEDDNDDDGGDDDGIDNDDDNDQWEDDDSDDINNSDSNDDDDDDDDGASHEETNYYDDLESNANSADENESLYLQLDNDALDSGSESADEHPYRVFGEEQSHPIPPARIEGTRSPDDTRWFLL
ncbi:hypothetical protein A1O7_04171 [Cladophialophora yegresii CBS 114405]|uniref:Heterokaryon incompatibility domain-containing protein n=1 Tax=Cladophialophora yegresii CBS 114405 TaxID=1182544 RepID=W9VWH8_9EURO|nr:uncharacterized protein A1O7_04171 [Cladophialophora yegresii CBS 114405]EXJ60023.1 hypothetical protein A1O7_04171 [Cladophialophora yegresii CBS 114405]